MDASGVESWDTIRLVASYYYPHRKKKLVFFADMKIGK